MFELNHVPVSAPQVVEIFQALADEPGALSPFSIRGHEIYRNRGVLGPAILDELTVLLDEIENTVLLFLVVDNDVHFVAPGVDSVFVHDLLHNQLSGLLVADVLADTAADAYHRIVTDGKAGALEVFREHHAGDGAVFCG